jgi:hypothetical protein
VPSHGAGSGGGRVHVYKPPFPTPAAAIIEAGQEALARGAWEEARSAFDRVLHTGDRDATKHSFRAVLEPEGSAEILPGLADALW